MASPTVPYVLGGTQTEQQRLAAQAQGLENPTRWMLDQINIKPGIKAAEFTPDLMLASGNAVELQAHMAALAKHLADPETTLIDRLVVQAWGTKPI